MGNVAITAFDRYDIEMSKSAKQLCFLLYPGVQLLDVAGPADVFAQANRESGEYHYHVRYVAQASPILSSAHLPLHCEPLPASMDGIDILLVPGANPRPMKEALDNTDLMNWLGRYANQTQVLCSICSGSLLLAKLGLLDGHRVTSHWAAIETLREMCPDSQVVDNMLYVQDGNLWTSAGVLSGVDMALAMVAKDLGRGIALTVAKNLVAFMLREGHQPQLSAPMNLQQKAADSSLLRLIQWLEGRVEHSVGVEEMAEYMSTSVRSLHRKCMQTLALSPAKLFTELKLEHGKLLLHQGEIPIKQIAFQCGFADSSAFSKAFSQRHKISPLQYRHQVSRP